VSAWRFEQTTSYIGSLEAKFISTPSNLPERAWPSTNQYRTLFFQTSTPIVEHNAPETY